MCQMSIVVETEGGRETVLENASTLEVTGEGVVVSALFEEPRVIAGARVKRIDFLDGVVTLALGGSGLTRSAAG